jgi:hypothetical protein
MGFSCSGFLNRLLRTVDFSSVISGRTLSHVASLIAYTFKQTDLILWEKHKSVEVRTRVRLEGEFQGQTNPHRIGVVKAVQPDPP